MRVGILGSGTVGQHLGSGFVGSGHEVMMGTRDPDKLSEWKRRAPGEASIGSFEEAARHGEILVLATKWANGATESAINMANKSNFGGKVLIDATNPLVFNADGQPPRLGLGYPESGGATVQKWLPDCHVVKAFNTMTAKYMADPQLEEGTPDLFIAGDDAEAKQLVTSIAKAWGWETAHDIGGIDQACLLEAMALVWIRWGLAHSSWIHAFKLLKK